MFQSKDSYFINYTKKMNPRKFREVRDTDNSNKSWENKTDDNTLNISFSCKLQWLATPLKFTCSKSTIETLEKSVKYIQS